jgi:hypothetical protein
MIHLEVHSLSFLHLMSLCEISSPHLTAYKLINFFQFSLINLMQNTEKYIEFINELIKPHLKIKNTNWKLTVFQILITSIFD